MNQIVKIGFAVALLLPLANAASADEFKLSSNQRIACSRGLMAGKLNTATCKSYAYLFNARTSEYFRCQVSLALTRDNKEVINVQADGGYSIWVSDNTKQRVRGCITISSGLGSDISKCLDMTFQ